MTEEAFFAALERGDLIDARRVLKELSDATPRTRLLFLDGLLLESKGKFEDALKKFDMALVMHLSDPQIWIAKARVLDRLGKRDLAKRAAERAVKLSPTDHSLRVVYGRILLRMNRYKEAMTEVDEALKARSDDPGALVLKGVLLSMMDQDYMAALSLFDTALNVDEEISEAWTNRGIVLRQIGDIDGAVLSFQKALALDPEDQTARQMLSNLGRQDLARVIRIDHDPSAGPGEGSVDDGDVVDGKEPSWEEIEEMEEPSPGPEKVAGEEIDLKCPRCSREFSLTVSGRTRFTCPGCGLQGEVD